MSIIENNTVNAGGRGNQLVAIPAFADGGMLYSRIDLIQKHHQSLQQYANGRVKGASHSEYAPCVERIATDLPKRGYPSSDAIIDKLENFLAFVSGAHREPPAVGTRHDWNYDDWNWTWDDLTSVAKYIQELERCEGNAQVWGLVWQGKTAQQLISSALEWIGSKEYVRKDYVTDNSWIIKYCPHDDSDPDRQQAVIDGIKMAHNWIWHDEISPLTVLSYGNKESEAMFDSGNVVFMRHWPSTWALLIKNSGLDKKIAVTYLPRSNRENPDRLSTLGGWELAVSKKSKHQSEAVDLALFLTDDDQQKRNAITGVLRPTINKLIDNPVEIQSQIGEYNGMFDDPKRAHVISALRPAKRSDLDWCKSPAPAGSSGADEPVAGQRAAAQAKPEPEAGVCFNDYFKWSDCFYTVVHDMLSDPGDVSRDKLQRIEKSEKCKCGAK
jgi:maltose-binding protein MalE